MYSSPATSYFTTNHDPDLPWLLKQILQPALNLLDQVTYIVSLNTNINNQYYYSFIA